MNELALLVTMAVAIIAALPGLYATIQQRRKDTTDVLSRYIEMTDHQAEQIAELRARDLEYREQLRKLSEELECWRAVSAEWRQGIDLLLGQLASNGLAPVWTPKRDTGDCVVK